MALQYVFDNVGNILRERTVAAGETISEGEFVTLVGNGEVAQFDPANDDVPFGIVVHNPRGDAIVEHDEDYVAYEDLWTYEAGDDLYVAPLREVDTILPEVIEAQDSPASSVPDFDQDEEVGIVILGSGETRIVPEGYTYDGTEYSSSGAGAYVPLGRVDHVPTGTRIQETYGKRIHTRLDNDVFPA